MRVRFVSFLFALSRPCSFSGLIVQVSRRIQQMAQSDTTAGFAHELQRAGVATKEQAAVLSVLAQHGFHSDSTIRYLSREDIETMAQVASPTWSRNLQLRIRKAASVLKSR